MPKQQNALTCYIHHTLAPELRRQGRVFPNGIADLIPIAVPLFKSLPPNEKARYEQMAKNTKSGVNKQANFSRRDNVGNIIAQRQDPRQQMFQKRKDDRAKIRMQFPAGDALLDCKYYIIGFEYMVEVECSPVSEFLPVEVGVIEWSMREGVIDTRHKNINPGDFPLGYRFKCQEHAEEFHKYPLEQIKTFDKNYFGIWSLIENFIKPQESGDLAVYCLQNDYEKVMGCLMWLHRRANTGRPITFNVRFLEDLAMELYYRQGKNIAEASILEMLTTTVFDYDPNTCCQVHEELECRHCALGRPRRYTFALSDALSVIYNFDLTEKHLPVRTGSTSSYVLTGAMQEQLVPGIASQPASGRSYTRAAEQFGGRDVRYDGIETIRSCTTVEPLEDSVSAPDFAGAMSRLSVRDVEGRTSPDVEIPLVPFPKVYDSKACAAISPRRISKPDAVKSGNLQHSTEPDTLPHYSSEPDISPFTAPGFGRGRGVAGIFSKEPSVSRGRGALRMMPDVARPGSSEGSAPVRAPPGFPGSGSGRVGNPFKMNNADISK